MKAERRTLAMRIEKRLVIQALKRWPEDYARLIPGFKSAKEAIDALEAHPGEWFIDGMLSTKEEG